MSWPWRPKTWEKGLRLQVRVSSITELLGDKTVLQEGKSQPPTALLDWSLAPFTLIPAEPPHDLPCLFNGAVRRPAIRLKADLWMSLESGRPEMPSESSAGGGSVLRLLSACSAVAQKESKHSMNREGEEEEEGEAGACCREEADSTPWRNCEQDDCTCLGVIAWITSSSVTH